MGAQPPSRAERDVNLDALKIAVDQWSRIEQTRLENEVKFMRSVLEGRASNRTGSLNLAVASSLLQTEIDQFIVTRDCVMRAHAAIERTIGPSGTRDLPEEVVEGKLPGNRQCGRLRVCNG